MGLDAGGNQRAERETEKDSKEDVADAGAHGADHVRSPRLRAGIARQVLMYVIVVLRVKCRGFANHMMIAKTLRYLSWGEGIRWRSRCKTR